MDLDELVIERIIADGDMDGLFAAVILKTNFPNAEVRFSHPAEIRGGVVDHLIDRKTAICDLPFHIECGLYLDHHATNRPSNQVQEEFTAAGGYCIWEDKPSAARVAWDYFSGKENLPSLSNAMEFVDRLDSGGLQLQELKQGHPLLWFSRSIDVKDDGYVQSLVSRLSSGMPLEQLLEEDDVMDRCKQQQAASERLNRIIAENVEVVDRLAILRMDDTGERTNGYALTAYVGEDCDACCIIHGWVDGDISTPDRPALSASFYCNSFLHPEGGIFDLTRMATLFDETGGGHYNACGCRVQPLSEDGKIANRPVESSDVEKNLAGWLECWRKR